jgi:hypothetical protein
VATAALAIMVLVLGLLYRRRFIAFLGVAERRHQAAAGVALLTVLDVVAVFTWARNPFAALVMVPSVHLWMLLAAPDLRPRQRWLRLAVVLLGVCAPLLVAVYYAQQLATGMVGFVWAGFLLIAGGQIGIGTLALWSLWLGCVVVVITLARFGSTAPRLSRRQMMIPVRGSLQYARREPLTGAESALRGLTGGHRDA